MSGFDVDPEELREFAGKLDGFKGTASGIAGLVSQADVGDKSWGVVGIFVKQTYTETLNDLKDLFKDLENGLDSGAGKFRGTAQGYQDQEDALKAIFNGIQIEIDGR